MNDEHDNDQTDREIAEKYRDLRHHGEAEAMAGYDRREDTVVRTPGRKFVGPWPDQPGPRTDRVCPTCGTVHQSVQESREKGGGVVRPNPIHTDRSAKSIDVRFYFNLDADEEGTLNDISQMIQDSPLMCDMISAYQLKNDGFSHLTPDDKPLA